MQGTWLVIYYHIIVKMYLETTSLTEVLIQLADCGLPSKRTIPAQRFQGIGKMRWANPETNITPPPQLDKVAERVNRPLTVAPERSKDETNTSCGFIEFLTQRD